jgi:quercetin dioxygenase-like cupin family protein
VELDVRQQPVLLPAGGGEVIGDAPDRRVEILSDADALNATWSRFGPHREGADLHVHRHHTDLFYVLEGELTVRLGPAGEPKVVTPGTLVLVPPLVVHGFRNGTDAELRYLNLHAPGARFSDYLRAMRDGRDFEFDQHDPPEDGGRSPDLARIGGEEVLTDGPGLRVALLADVAEIAVAEVRRAEGAPSAELSSRTGALESLYVLEGELALTTGRRELQAGAGAWVQVPAGVECTVDGAARYLSIST